MTGNDKLVELEKYEGENERDEGSFTVHSRRTRVIKGHETKRGMMSSEVHRDDAMRRVSRKLVRDLWLPNSHLEVVNQKEIVTTHCGLECAAKS